MSGVLERLVGQATGARVAGLRPRLPSRFEAGLREAGFGEMAVEVPAAAPAPAVASEPAARQAGVPEPPPLQPAAVARAREPVPGTEPPMTSRRLVAEPEARPVPARVVPPALLPVEPDAPLAAVPGPEPAVEREVVVMAETAEPAVTPVLRGEAPAALLQPAAPPDLAAVIARVFPPAASAAEPKREARAEAGAGAVAEPEISIHIGRLDIRSEPQRPPAPRPAPRPLPSLGDYLRGRRP